MDDPEHGEDTLTAEDILTFGPVVESVVWHIPWVLQERAPIAVAAGRPRFGQVFDEDGVGKAVVIRPCVSRGRRIRGLPPIYTPQMLERHAGVFSGWPTFLDHVPPELAEVISKRGRSVKELGGQVLKSYWNAPFVHEDDGQYGYRQGAVLAEVWANEFVRKLVGNNPNVLHTSINAWPTSGKPGTAPWNANVKGMLIEGIRRQPQGSLDYVPRGGAGGRLLSEGDEGGWPEPGWTDGDREAVVSLAESFYSAAEMEPDFTKMTAAELRSWVQENRPDLAGVLVEQDAEDEPLIKALMKKGKSRAVAEKIVAGSKEEKAEEHLTPADVRSIFEELQEGSTTRLEETETQIRESFEATLAEREEQRSFEREAHQLIESADRIPPTWKADLVKRYSMTPDGAPPALVVEEYEKDGKTISKLDALRERVADDLEHVRTLIAEAQGKPRVTDEGGARKDAGGDEGKRTNVEESDTDPFAEAAMEYGLAESEDAALALVGVEPEKSGKGDD